MKIEHVCRSGNRVEICLPDQLNPRTFELSPAEWESYPPSGEDLREFNEVVYPNQIVPVLKRRFEEQTGKPHRVFPIEPGLYGFKPKEPEE